MASTVPGLRKAIGDSAKKLKNTMNLNQVQLIGRVTRDPELKALPSGVKVTKFGLATNHVYKDKEGNKKESVSFHNCVAFGKPAEVIAQWIKKGQEMFVQGRIEYREWETKEGGKRNATEININDFQFGQKAKGSEEVKEEKTEEVETNDEINPEDIPF